MPGGRTAARVRPERAGCRNEARPRHRSSGQSHESSEQPYPTGGNVNTSESSRPDDSACVKVVAAAEVTLPALVRRLIAAGAEEERLVDVLCVAASKADWKAVREHAAILATLR